MDISPVGVEAFGSAVSSEHCVEGYTDAHDVFVPPWVPSAVGEYFVAAMVTKSGHVPGKSACFLSVVK